MCKILDVPRSTYYQSLNKTISKRERENNKLIQRIITVHQDSKQRYGAPNIHHLLVDENYDVSIKRIQRLMKKAKKLSFYVSKILT